MAKKKLTNGVVAMDREEYSALKALAEDTHPQLVAKHVRILVTNDDLINTINVQGIRLAEMDRRCALLEQLLALRREIVTASGGVEVTIMCAASTTDGGKEKNASLDAIAAALKTLPRLTGVRIFHPLSRQTTEYMGHAAGDKQPNGPASQQALQANYIRELREDNARLVAMVKEHEVELGQLRVNQPAQEEKK